MKNIMEKIDATRDFWFKLYWPDLQSNLTSMPFQTGDIAKNDINVDGGGMITFFQSVMVETKAMALRVIPENQPQPEFEEFYPVVYFGKLGDDMVRPYGMFGGFKLRPYDVVVDQRGNVHFGQENLKTILDLPSREILVERYVQKYGKAPKASVPKKIAAQNKLPENSGGHGRDDDVPF